jgi:hypothetical protein
MTKSNPRVTDTVQRIGDQITRTASATVHERTIDPETVAEQVKDIATQAVGSAIAAAEQVKSTATDAARAAESAVDQGFERAAEATQGAADLARQAAGNLAQGAASLGETDVAGMRDHLRALIRRYPAPSLAVGLMLGFLMLGFAIAWLFRRQ